MNVLTEPACIDVIIVQLAEGVSIRSTGSMIIPLAWGMLDFDVDMVSEVLVVVVVIAVIVSEVVALVSFAIDSRDGVMTGVLTGTVISAVFVNDINALPGIDAKTWSALVPASSENTLPFRCGASSCWPAATRIPRALQTRMPSYHV